MAVVITAELEDKLDKMAVVLLPTEYLDKLAVSLLPFVDLNDHLDKLAEAMLVKDSVDGHHIAGTPDEYKHGWIKVGVGVDSKDLSLKKNGDVVHKPTNTKIGHIDKKSDFPNKGTSTFVTSHENGTQVYNGVYKKDAMAAMARYHNHAVSKEGVHGTAAAPVSPSKPAGAQTLSNIPEGSTPLMMGNKLVGYQAPNGDAYDVHGVNMTTGAPDKPQTIPSTNVPKALTGGAAYVHAQQSQGHLNPSEMNALSAYGNPGGYKTVNPFLNKNGMVYDSDAGEYLSASPAQTAQAKDIIKNLDSAFAKSHPTTQDMVVHRRLGNSINDLIGPPGSSVGKTFTNKAYVSTTTAANAIPGNGYGYESKKTLMDIQVGKGSKVLMGQQAEKEVILPRGSKFTVVSDEMKPDGTRHVKVLYNVGSGDIGQSGLPAPKTEAPKPVAAPSINTDPQQLHDLADQISETASFNHPAVQSLHLAGEALTAGDKFSAMYHLQNALDEVPPGHPTHTQIQEHLTKLKSGAVNPTASAMSMPTASHGLTVPVGSSSHVAQLKDLADKVFDETNNGAIYKTIKNASLSVADGKHDEAAAYLKKAQQQLLEAQNSPWADAHFKATAGQLHSEIEPHIKALSGHETVPTLQMSGAITLHNAKGEHIGSYNAQTGDTFDHNGVKMGYSPDIANAKNKLNTLHETSKPVNAPSGNMIDSTDLSMKVNGDVVHKQTKQVIGQVVKQKDFPSKGTTTFTVTHNDGTQVYHGVYKGKSLAALAQHHNTTHVGGAKPTTAAPISHGGKTEYGLQEVLNNSGTVIGKWDPQNGQVFDSKGTYYSNGATSATNAFAHLTGMGHEPKGEVPTAGGPHVPLQGNEIHEPSTGVFLPPPGATAIHDENGKPLGSWHPETYEVKAPNGKYVAVTAIKDKAEAALRVNAKNDPASLEYKKVVGKPGSYESKLSGMSHGPMPLYKDEAYGKTVKDAMNHAELTTAEADGVRSYTGSAYEEMNKYLLSGKTANVYSGIKEKVAQAESALAKATNKDHIAVMRNVPISTIKKIFGAPGSKVGKTFKENKFISTTTSATPMHGFGEAQIFYHLSPGTHAMELNAKNLSMHPQEREVLLGPGQSFKIVNDTTINGVRQITLET